MFTPGDHVFYPKGGVFVIQQKSRKDIAGRTISFFDLLSHDGKTKISIPERNVKRVGVRSLLTPQEMDVAMDVLIPDHKLTKLHHKNRKSRFELLRQTGNFDDMGIVAATIHNLIKKTKATFEEKRMYDQVRKRLADEIAIVKDLESPDAEKFLEQCLDVAVEKPPAPEPEEVEVEDGAIE